MESIRTTRGNLLAYSLHKNDPSSQDLVILIHGTCGHRRNVFFPALSIIPKVNILSFDFEGNGDSQGEFKIGGLQQEVETIHDVVSWAQSIGFKVQALIGHSKGGNEVLMYAGTYSDVPLVIAIAARYDMTIIPSFLNPLLPEIEGKGNAIYTFRGRDYVIDKEGIDERRNLCMDKYLENVRSNVVLIAGDNDNLTNISDCHNIENRLGHYCARKVVVEGADHMFTKHHEALSSLISSILQDLIALNR